MERQRTTRLLLACGALGAPLFVIAFLIEGASREGYSTWRNFVSQLSLGDQGWMQSANFLVTGSLMLAFAAGLRRALRSGRAARWGPILIAVYALGLLVAGIFATDPALGYPPGASGGAQSTHARVHDLGGLLVFSALPAACFVLARRFAASPRARGWMVYSIVTGALVVLFLVAADVAAALDKSGTLPNAPAGLLQRISIIAGWSWIMLLALRLISERPARVIHDA